MIRLKYVVCANELPWLMNLSAVIYSANAIKALLLWKCLTSPISAISLGASVSPTPPIAHLTVLFGQTLVRVLSCVLILCWEFRAFSSALNCPHVPASSWLIRWERRDASFSHRINRRGFTLVLVVSLFLAITVVLDELDSDILVISGSYLYLSTNLKFIAPRYHSSSLVHA